VVGGPDKLPYFADHAFVIAVGNNHARSRCFRQASACGLVAAALVHPLTTVGNWDRISDAERTGLVGENIAFDLKDMVRISDLKSRVTRSYHRASREFHRLREDRLRGQAEPEPEAQPAPESQPQPQAAEFPAGPQPAPESAGPVHQDTPPDVPVEPPTRFRSHPAEGTATIRTDAVDHTAALPDKSDF
jgi:hypothetical protein